MIKIDILTLFPEMFQGPFDHSIIKRARDRKLIKVYIHNLRDWTTDKHRTVDDRPFGGGTGMILMVEPIDKALRQLKSKVKTKPKVILLSPRGKVFSQKTAKQLSSLSHLILICGHYEGADERVRNLVDEEISIGDYVLTGGELPAMVLVDSIVRLIPGVLEKKDATKKESFANYQLKTANDQRLTTNSQLLEYPQYTRPANYKGQKVPQILLSGNHKEIEKWQLQQSIEITKKVRPDLLKKSNDSND